MEFPIMGCFKLTNSMQGMVPFFPIDPAVGLDSISIGLKKWHIKEINKQNIWRSTQKYRTCIYNCDVIIHNCNEKVTQTTNIKTLECDEIKAGVTTTPGGTHNSKLPENDNRQQQNSNDVRTPGSIGSDGVGISSSPLQTHTSTCTQPWASATMASVLADS